MKSESLINKNKRQSLTSCQEAFSDALLNQNKHTQTLSNLNYPERLDIYQNNYQQSLMGCLLSTFIQTQKLIEPSEFIKFSTAYLSEFPSIQENLTMYGDHFSYFLNKQKQHAVIVDLAIYDYSRIQCYYANNHCAFDLDTFINSSDQEQLLSSFIKPDSLVVFTSDYDLEHIIQSPLLNHASLSKLKPFSDTHYYLLFRELGKVKLKTIEAFTYQALYFFSEPHSVESLTESELEFFTHLIKKNFLILNSSATNSNIKNT